MFIEKIITKTIFDSKVLIEGNKVHAKYKSAISDDYDYWEFDFIGSIKWCGEDVIYIEDPNDRDYNPFTDESYARRHKITLEEVKVGWWVLELIESI